MLKRSNLPRHQMIPVIENVSHLNMPCGLQLKLQSQITGVVSSKYLICFVCPSHSSENREHRQVMWKVTLYISTLFLQFTAVCFRNNKNPQRRCGRWGVSSSLWWLKHTKEVVFVHFVVYDRKGVEQFGVKIYLTSISHSDISTHGVKRSGSTR